MAEEIARQTAFEYRVNSNLVLQADRSLLPRRGDEPSGEPETLSGKINPKDFGDRAVRNKPKDLPNRIEKEKKRYVCRFFFFFFFLLIFDIIFFFF